MKRLIFFLLTITVVIVAGVACTNANSTAKPADTGTVVQTGTAVPSSLPNDVLLIPLSSEEPWEPEMLDPMPEAEPDPFNENVPLSRENQISLMEVCEDFGVPYALALGLIEKETNFRNVVGDDGASTGYMQIQQKWHWDRMERLGVNDLLDPKGNFQVGCDFLSELYARYDDWGMALTVYNMGHNPGYITNYAYDVLDNYASWKELVENYD